MSIKAKLNEKINEKVILYIGIALIILAVIMFIFEKDFVNLLLTLGTLLITIYLMVSSTKAHINNLWDATNKQIESAQKQTNSIIEITRIGFRDLAENIEKILKDNITILEEIRNGILELKEKIPKETEKKVKEKLEILKKERLEKLKPKVYMKIISKPRSFFIFQTGYDYFLNIANNGGRIVEGSKIIISLLPGGKKSSQPIELSYGGIIEIKLGDVNQLKRNFKVLKIEGLFIDAEENKYKGNIELPIRETDWTPMNIEMVS